MGGSEHLGWTVTGISAGSTALAYRVGCNACLVGGGANTLGMGVSSYLIHDGQDFAGHLLGATTSGFTTFFMGRRYLSLRHPFVPNGILATTSALSFAYNAYKANEWADSW